MYWKLREWPAAADALGQLIASEQAKRNVANPAVNAAQAEIAKNPASVLDNALAQAQSAAGLPPSPPAAAPADAATKPAPLLDPVLSRLVLNRAVALSLANDRRGLKEIGRNFGKAMATTPLADPFAVLTSPDSGLTDSIGAQMKSVDQLGVFVDQYKQMLQSEALSAPTEPSPDTGPLAPMDNPAGSSGAAAPATPSQTADQAPAQPAGQQGN
jgi:hypothetical protein